MIAACKPAARSAASSAANTPSLARRSTASRNAVLRPENEKSQPGAAQHRPRQGKTRGIAARRFALDRRPAGIAEAEQLRALVEGLARGIVDGRAETAIAPDPFDDQRLAMAAGNQQQQIGKWDIRDKAHAQRMAFEMIDRDKGQLAGKGDRFGLHHADDDAADEARPARRGHRVEVAETDAGRAQGLFDHRVEMIEMRPRRDLGHDAAKGPMLGGLREHDIAADEGRLVAHHGGGGLIAARLDPEHFHAQSLAGGSPSGNAHPSFWKGRGALPLRPLPFQTARA